MSKFYTIEEVSQLINVPADSIREWISEGKVSAARRAGDLVLRHHEVQRLISEFGTQEPAPEEEAPTAFANVAPPKPPKAPTARYASKAKAAPPQQSVYYGYEESTPQPMETAGESEALGSASPSLRQMDSPDGEGEAPLDYSSLYDTDLDEYESQLRYLRMELPLPSAASVLARSGGNGARLGGEERSQRSKSAGLNHEQAEQIVERAVEPLARAQARLIKLFNETKEENRKPSALPAPGSGSGAAEKGIARLESQLKQIQAAVEGEYSAKALRNNVDAVQKGLESLTTLCQKRFESLAQTSLTVSGKSDPKLLESLQALQNLPQLLEKRIGAALDKAGGGAVKGGGGPELESLRQKYELLNQKYANLRAEHERTVDENSKLNAEGSDLESVLNRLEVLRAPLEAYGLGANDFAEKVVEHVDALNANCRELEARYEACEEETSSLQVLLDRLQSDNQELKEKNQELQAVAQQAGKDSGELQRLREACEQLKAKVSGSDAGYTKLQDQCLKLKEQNQDLQQASEARERQVRELQAVLAKNEQQAQELAKQHNESLEKARAGQRDLQERLEQSQGLLAGAKQDLRKAQEQLELNHRELENLRTQAEHSNSAYDDLSEAYKKREEELEVSQAELVQIQTQIKSIQAQSAELENMAADAHREASEATAKLGEYETRLEEAQSAQEGLRAQLKKAEERLQTVQVERDAQERARTQALEEAAEELRQVQHQLQESQKKLSEQEAAHHKKIQDLQVESTKVEAEKARLLRRINTLQAKNEALRAEIDESREFGDNYDAVKAVEVRMQDQLDAVTLELSETKAKLKELENSDNAAAIQERDVALSQLEELNHENEALRQEVAKLQKEGAGGDQSELLEALANYESANLEKERLLQSAQEERAQLREELERAKQLLFEQQQLYERERKEWSEILAKQVKGEGAAVASPLDGNRRPAGFRLFKNRGSI